MPIKRLTCTRSALAAALFVVAPAGNDQQDPRQASPSKACGLQAVQASAQRKSTHRTHGKLADTAPQAAHSDSLASSTDFAETAAVVAAPTQSELPIPASLQAGSFTLSGSPSAANATPAWLAQAPLFNPAGMLVQSTKPTYSVRWLRSARMSPRAVSRQAASRSDRRRYADSRRERYRAVTDLRKALISLAMNLRHVRYVRGGHDPSTGFDCSGFVRYVFELMRLACSSRPTPPRNS